jgi:predicted enzyme related to lactoylglutathione lyase
MRIVHFEIPADDPARAIAFYQSAFGWSFDAARARAPRRAQRRE